MRDLSPKQEKLLSALLTEKDVRAAAAKAGVSEATGWRWLKETEFVAEYRRLRRDAVEQATTQLQQASGEAVETLRRNLNCRNPQTEVSAAKIILEQATKAVELIDHAERLEVLENELRKQNNKA